MQDIKNVTYNSIATFEIKIVERKDTLAKQ